MKKILLMALFVLPVAVKPAGIPSLSTTASASLLAVNITTLSILSYGASVVYKNKKALENAHKRIDALPLRDDQKIDLKKRSTLFSAISTDRLAEFMQAVESHPWNRELKVDDELNLQKLKNSLDENIFGRNEIKERLLDYVAGQLSAEKKGDSRGKRVLCLVGPHMSGKMSFVHSLARGLDLSELVVSSESLLFQLKDQMFNSGFWSRLLTKVDARNPMICLKNISRIKAPFDPGFVRTLELSLDYTRNANFWDEVMGTSINLSHVFWVVTAESADEIPAKMRNHVYIVNVPAYTREERTHLVLEKMVPCLITQLGLEGKGLELIFNQDIIEPLIEKSLVIEEGRAFLEYAIRTILSRQARSIIECGIPIEVTKRNILDFARVRDYSSPPVEDSRSHLGIDNEKTKVLLPGTIKTTFDDVAGLHDIKENLRSAIEFLKNPEKSTRLGARVPTGILLSGDPGNGKTLLARAVVGEAGCSFISVSGSEFVQTYVGVGAQRVRELFKQARTNAPCVIFIDEIDAIGRSRMDSNSSGGSREYERTLNQLLVEMDGFAKDQHSPVIVLAATNFPSLLDKALLRPGRFDEKLEVSYPDVADRKKILELYFGKVKKSLCVDIDMLARGTQGFSAASLENLVNLAASRATRRGAIAVESIDIEEARDTVLVGQKGLAVVSEKVKRETAYHEAGHALLNILLPETDPFYKVTVLPRGWTLGISWSLPETDRYCMKKSEMEAYIMICLGGLLGEKIGLNMQTTGVSNDLMKANSTARKMVCELGMSTLGPIYFDGKNKDTDEVNKEVSKIVQDCYNKAETLLRQNEDKLHIFAQALCERETMTAHEVCELLGLPQREVVKFDNVLSGK